MRIALTGNPNSGKTTMYNALTGRNEKIGNWAGVTVDRKESPIKKDHYDGAKELIAVDLPGAYSMSPFTSEESITSGYVKNEHPDAIINIVDATNLSRSLFFTTQLLELGIPVIVALNKNDINEKKGTQINEALLSEKLGCPVIKTTSTTDTGLKDVVAAAAELEGKGQVPPYVQGNINLHDKTEVEAADRKRFDFVNGIVKEVEVRKVQTKEKTKGDAIDKVLTNPISGLIIFAAIMYLVFFISQSTLGTYLADILTGWIETFQEWVGGLLENANPFLYALLVDGIIGGVGAVVGFLPLVMVRNERERRTTAMLATFMPCGAKLPVIALFTGAFFPESKWVGPVMYFVGILLILLGALLVKAVTGMKYRKSFFIIELPEYKVPSLKIGVLSMLNRGKAYIKKAGTVILVCNTVVQIMQSFNWHFEAIEEGAENTSILASIAGPFAVLLVPVVGIAAWQLAAAAITGFIAKENVVGTIATVYAITNFIDPDELELIGSGNAVATAMGITKVAALAYLMFNLYTPPCFAALGAMNSEMQSGKWLFAGICLQLATGFTVGFLVYQIGTLITTGSLGAGFVGGLIAVLVFAAVIVTLIMRANRAIDTEYQLD